MICLLKNKPYTVKAFILDNKGGNAAGVILDADHLDEAQMQSIATELNYSETAFILTSPNPEADFHIRFFTPQQEVKMCGHASIAANYLRHLLQSQTGHYIQSTAAGLVKIEIQNDGTVFFLQERLKILAQLSLDAHDKLLTSLNLQTLDIHLSPQVISSSKVPKLIIQIESVEKLYSLEPNFKQLSKFHKEIDVLGSLVFAKINEHQVAARFFAPNIGINEDPANGSSMGPLAAYIDAHKILSNNKFEVLQSQSFGSESLVLVELTKNDQQLLVKVGGKAKLLS